MSLKAQYIVVEPFRKPETTLQDKLLNTHIVDGSDF